MRTENEIIRWQLVQNFAGNFEFAITVKKRRAPQKRTRISFACAGSSYVLQISRTESSTPIRNCRQRTHRPAYRSGGGGDGGSISDLLLHGGGAAWAMSRNCRTGRYAHTGAGAASSATAITIAVGDAFFVGPSLHALCVRGILLLVGVYAVLELLSVILVGCGRSLRNSKGERTRERTSMSASAGCRCARDRDGALDVDVLEDAKRTRSVSASSASSRS